MNPEMVHMIGICGAGMTPLAIIMKRKGFDVTGCDRNLNENAEILKKEGIVLSAGHSTKHLEGVSRVIFSRAVDESCNEISQALKKGIKIQSRGEALREQLEGRILTGIAGTHGKTTTSSMLVHILMYNNKDVLGITGGSPVGWESGLIWSENGAAVCELDESDRTFLLFNPNIGVITSVEADHIGKYYSGEKDVSEAFLKFAGNSEKCLLNVCDKLTAEIANSKTVKSVTLGESPACDIRYVIEDECLFMRGEKISIRMRGEHNLRNASCALAVAELMGVSPMDSAEALKSFSGVRRRMETVFDSDFCTFISDYAHHPTELKNSIEALKTGDKKLTIVFQPHLYSRTKEFHLDFAKGLLKADNIILMPIYPAREKPMTGVTSELIADDLKTLGKEVCVTGSKEELMSVLKKSFSGGILALLGAGDADSYRDEITEMLKGTVND
ncbi:UDP-N-acetylmuramate--L-alanine ligase [candidate division WOR-3 bacterium]|nr:UDP-N-acetylmuramate--L-alanine ligase [candidate division WOR-3 bacterium]